MSQKHDSPGPVGVFFGRLFAILFLFASFTLVFSGLSAVSFMGTRPGVPVPISIRQGFMVSWLLILVSMAMMRVLLFVNYGEKLSPNRERHLRLLFLLFISIGFSMLVVMARSIRILD